MGRIFLFALTNIAVVVVINIVISLLGGDRLLNQYGLNMVSLTISSLAIGFTGAIISLFMSKSMAKWSTGLHIIDTPQNQTEQWLLATVDDLAKRAGIGMPEVGVFEGEANAFATGAFRNSALVAVSTGLLQGMDEDEVRAVLAHEMSHVANGDMITMTLMQGIVNTFVIFFARLIAALVSNLTSRDRENSGRGTYMIVSTLMQMVLGVLATIIVMAFSRHREYRADSGAADLLGTAQPMINALQRLSGIHTAALPSSLKAMGIFGDWSGLFASHPALPDRIAALQQRR